MRVIVCALSFCLRVSAPWPCPFGTHLLGFSRVPSPAGFALYGSGWFSGFVVFFNDLTVASIRKKAAKVNEKGKCFQ